MRDLMLADGRVHVMQGRAEERLREVGDATVDAVVTDPPYGLSKEPDIAEVLRHWLAGDDYAHKGGGFMGKSWDSFVPGPSVWREVYRVLKPGGHVLCFAGTRTADLMSLSLRLAGFEIRDTIPWLYGSGFPKSLDVSKAFDKDNGKHKVDLVPFGEYVRTCREHKGYSRKQLDEIMGTNTAASWWEGRKSGVQLPSLETYKQLKQVLGMDERFDTLIEWAEAQREITGEVTKARSEGSNSALPTMGAQTKYITYDITAAATSEAQKWEGWGTALKPANEPIIMARKPLEGTVAGNVQKYGTGAINIDGSRVGGSEAAWERKSSGRDGYTYSVTDLRMRDKDKEGSPSGRWPANVILTHSPGCVAIEPGDCVEGCPVAMVDGQSGQTSSSSSLRGTHGRHDVGSPDTERRKDYSNTSRGHEDAGGASRFFATLNYGPWDYDPAWYTAKASKTERNRGLETLPTKTHPWVQHREEVHGGKISEAQERFATLPSQNNHPTVKPVSLMRYLVRLITPPGGLCLDPFAGSGTTGCAAVLEGFRFLGCELDEDENGEPMGYIEIERGRISHALERPGEWAAKGVKAKTPKTAVEPVMEALKPTEVKPKRKSKTALPDGWAAMSFLDIQEEG